MRHKSSLFRGAALGALIALGIGGAAAQAKTRPTSEAARIQALESQVQMLTDRLNAQAATSQQAQAAAQQAQATAQAADAEIKTIPAQVQSAVAALPKPKPGWEASTKISGRMYFNVSNINLESNGVKPTGSPNGTNFDLKRFYIGVDHKFNDVLSGNLTTDVTYDSGVGNTQIFVKKAYLQAKWSDAAVLRLGSTDLPWVPFAEGVYGYRHIENTIADRTKFATSADWGVHFGGELPAGMATIGYQVAVINGAGYKKPGIGTGNRSKSIDVEGRLSAEVSNFVVGVGGYSGKLGKDVQGVMTYNTAQRLDALVAYKNKRFTLGGEYFYASEWNDVTNAGATNSSEGYSVFGSYKFTDKFSVFGRYDWMKPKGDTAPLLEDNYFNVGVQYSPAKIVDFALVYKRDKVAHGTWGTSNGTIGGAIDGTYDEVGIWSQFRW
jgi:hypothetical protein